MADQEKVKIVVGNKYDENHMEAMFEMLDLYMQDPMGKLAPLDDKLKEEIKTGLLKQSNYLFFLAFVDERPVGIANCFINFSTFKAKQLVNIHDFAVSPFFRNLGIGKKLMQFVLDYCRENKFCRVNLEVRHDNYEAQRLYRKLNFEECKPAMYFWEHNF